MRIIIFYDMIYIYNNLPTLEGYRALIGSHLDGIILPALAPIQKESKNILIDTLTRLTINQYNIKGQLSLSPTR